MIYNSGYQNDFSLIHLSCVDAAIAVLVVHSEHQPHLLLGTSIRGQVDHLHVKSIGDDEHYDGDVVMMYMLLSHHDKVAEVNSAAVLAESSKGL